MNGNIVSRNRRGSSDCETRQFRDVPLSPFWGTGLLRLRAERLSDMLIQREVHLKLLVPVIFPLTKDALTPGMSPRQLFCN